MHHVPFAGLCIWAIQRVDFVDLVTKAPPQEANSEVRWLRTSMRNACSQTNARQESSDTLLKFRTLSYRRFQQRMVPKAINIVECVPEQETKQKNRSAEAHRTESSAVFGRNTSSTQSKCGGGQRESADSPLDVVEVLLDIDCYFPEFYVALQLVRLKDWRKRSGVLRQDWCGP